MIFQCGIKLDLDEKHVEAIIDFDSGLIGFSEKIDEQVVEYTFALAPRDFKIALMDKLIPISEERSLLNMKISNKSELAQAVLEFQKRSK